jgi:hypothetical protein
MSNLSKLQFRKATVAVLTALLMIAIAAPLVSFAAAAGAPTASLVTKTGPNGTLVEVQGTGFVPNGVVSATNSPINVTVDGLPGKAITTSATLSADATTTIKSDYQLKTDANGVLSGYFIIYNLSPGAHTVIIYDASTSVVAGTFTITKPTVTITPSSVVAGSSVTVSATGFPTSNPTIETTFVNKIVSANFSGNNIPVSTGAYTDIPTNLSSNKLATNAQGAHLGTYSATVSLPGINQTYGPLFNLTDAWNNVAGVTLSLTTPTVTLSPNSGPVGTIVTATITGFGPSSEIIDVAVGNVVGSTSVAQTGVPVSPKTTEQGTSVFLFKLPAGDNTTKAGVSGPQTVTVVDDKGNVGTATFTVTPKVSITLGTATTNSGTTIVPAGASAVIGLTASGFKPETPLTFGYSPNVPSEWTTPSKETGSSWNPVTQINAANQLLTDANGAVNTVVSATGVAPSQIGQYWISISDGTNTVTTIFNVVAPGDILAVPIATGAAGQTGVQITYFGAGTTPTGVTLGTSSATAPSGLVAAQPWPVATTATFKVPDTASGVQRVALVGGSFNTVSFTTISPSVTVVSPSSASVGTTVTVVGNGFANNGVSLAIDGATVVPNVGTSSILGNTILTTFNVPTYLPGTYSLSVDDTVNTATTSFTVAASQIQVTPTTSAPTTSTGGKITIAITGAGFKASDTLTVKFDNIPISATPTSIVGLTVANTNGGILLLSGIELPTKTTAGTHTITVQGSTGAYAQTTFTITPKLNSLPAVRPGQAVAITGVGFAKLSPQTLTVNGTATTWLNVGGSTPAALPQGTPVQTDDNGTLYTGHSVGFVVPSTETSTALRIVVTDAAGNSASADLIILATPKIALGASSVIAGTPITLGVSINGTGFTPSSIRNPTNTAPISAALYQGSTFVSSVTLSHASVTVANTGSFGTTAGVKFVVPASVTADTYTLQFTIGTAGVSTPIETASTTITVLGAPQITAPTIAASGSNVSITVTGLTAISSATFGNSPLVVANVVEQVSGVDQFGGITVSSTGANAYTKDTWFIVPSGLFAGTYLLTLTDSNTGLTAQTTISVAPSITVSPTTGSKGTTVTVTGTGFAATSALTAKINGAAVVLSTTTTTSTGAIAAATTFTIPVTSEATNTLTITDAIGNTASAAFNVSAPVVQITPSTAGAGSTIQVIGSGFTPSSPIVIQVDGQVVTTVPANLEANTGGSFITYVTVPTGLNGEVTVTATDNSNNVGTATLTVGGSTGTGVPSQQTMTSTAQTTTPSGTATTTFTSGSTVKAGFMLQSASGTRDVVVAVTWQQGAKVYSMASFQTTMTTTPSAVSFSNLLPAGVTGTWTATLQVFAIDGVTPLGVTTLTFTVS